MPSLLVKLVSLQSKVEASLGIHILTLNLAISLKLSQVKLHRILIVRRELQNVIN
jgi:hypothetical protein